MTPVLAFTGSGGKTTTSESLAREAAARGHRVVLTTTTKIRVPPRHAPASSLDEVREALATLGPALDPPEPLFVGDASPDRKKLTGPSPELLEEIRRSGLVDLVVVEADGSRGASLKAYRETEPVWPLHVDRGCVLVGVDVLGEGRESSLVHRAPDLWCFLGLSEEARLSPEDVARAIFLQPGYLDRGDCPLTILLNKVDTPARVDAARRLQAAFEAHLAGSPVEALAWRGTCVPSEVEITWRRGPDASIRGQGGVEA